jgi:hypothetical protein
VRWACAQPRFDSAQGGSRDASAMARCFKPAIARPRRDFVVAVRRVADDRIAIKRFKSGAVLVTPTSHLELLAIGLRESELCTKKWV